MLCSKGNVNAFTISSKITSWYFGSKVEYKSLKGILDLYDIQYLIINVFTSFAKLGSLNVLKIDSIFSTTSLATYELSLSKLNSKRRFSIVGRYGTNSCPIDHKC